MNSPSVSVTLRWTMEAILRISTIEFFNNSIIFEIDSPIKNSFDRGFLKLTL
ncbi:Uncharacterized protein NV38_0000728 [Leptospira kirschneri serovar Mozdok]|nr:Uncharacterized protein NV38_0000728 [Leptospira kirschneri serovar Mozdok]NDK04331.1 hypothetical protein [Leptospira kirschneri serovar Mozdok]